MPIKRLTRKGNRVDKINEIIDWIEMAEGNILVQSQAGTCQLPNKIDLSGFAQKDELRQLGIPVP